MSIASGRSRYSVALVTVVVFLVTGSFRAVVLHGAVALPYVRAVEGNGLGACGLLLCEGFGEALLSQVPVPQLGEVFVFVVKLRLIAVVALSDEAAPLLNTCVLVAVKEGI